MYIITLYIFLAQGFSSKFCESVEKTYFVEHLQTVVSGLNV